MKSFLIFSVSLLAGLVHSAAEPDAKPIEQATEQRGPAGIIAGLGALAAAGSALGYLGGVMGQPQGECRCATPSFGCQGSSVRYIRREIPFQMLT